MKKFVTKAKERIVVRGVIKSLADCQRNNDTLPVVNITLPEAVYHQAGVPLGKQPLPGGRSTATL